MATIMEKDVLLELVSYSLAMLHNKEDSADVSKNIRNLRIMKKNLINTEFNDIDYKATTTRIKQLGGGDERFPKDGTFAVRKIFSSEDGKPLDVKMIEDVLEGRSDYNKMP